MLEDYCGIQLNSDDGFNLLWLITFNLTLNSRPDRHILLVFHTLVELTVNYVPIEFGPFC